NDNVSADIYGFEAEAIVRPDPAVAVNLGFSYLHSKVTEDKFTSNPRDLGGGRADAVIIKDLSNGANCAVAPGTPGNAAGSNGFVNAVNGGLNAATGAGLQPTTAFPAGGGIASTGAFGICSVLAEAAVDVNTGDPTPTALLFDPNGIQVLSAGVPVNIKGNQLPQAPNYKFSAGVQYTVRLGGGEMTLVPRFDLAYTGESYGSIFNGNVNRIKGYAQVNAQLQLNGPDDKWYVKGFIQNIFDANSVTGLYITDQSSGNYTNIFTLEPRRYGIAAGVRF